MYALLCWHSSARILLASSVVFRFLNYSIGSICHDDINRAGPSLLARGSLDAIDGRWSALAQLSPVEVLARSWFNDPLFFRRTFKSTSARPYRQVRETTS